MTTDGNSVGSVRTLSLKGGGQIIEEAMEPEFDLIFRQIRQWRDLGQGVALATVVRTWGSSPRPAGSHLAIDSSGRSVGSLSDGCVEPAVIGEAQAVIRDGQPRRMQFAVGDEQARQVGLACGGNLEVFVERVE